MQSCNEMVLFGKLACDSVEYEFGRAIHKALVWFHHHPVAAGSSSSVINIPATKTSC